MADRQQRATCSSLWGREPCRTAKEREWLAIDEVLKQEVTEETEVKESSLCSLLFLLFHSAFLVLPSLLNPSYSPENRRD